MNKIIKVAVLGSTGYVGLELVKILMKHPKVLINFLGCENNPNKRLKNFDDSINDKKLPLLNLNKNFNCTNSNIVFLALPHGVSQNFVKKFYNKIRIIDLSADFRLDSKNIYKLNYGIIHKCPDLLNKFVYGLPEINKKNIIKNTNIAVPGCYPTSILLPLIPLLRKKLINTNNIIIDSKSGYSGAGKKFDIQNIKNSKDLNFYNYKTNDHRHICEIRQELEKNSKQKIKFSFNPHILPVYSGLMSTIYCDLKKGINKKDIFNCLKSYSKNMPFLKIANTNEKVDFFSIQKNNNCIIKLYKHHDNTKIIIVSVIDNLIKGGAGQAVQCFNISMNLDEKLGLV